MEVCPVCSLEPEESWNTGLQSGRRCPALRRQYFTNGIWNCFHCFSRVEPLGTYSHSPSILDQAFENSCAFIPDPQPTAPAGALPRLSLVLGGSNSLHILANPFFTYLDRARAYGWSKLMGPQELDAATTQIWLCQHWRFQLLLLNLTQQIKWLYC